MLRNVGSNVGILRYRHQARLRQFRAECYWHEAYIYTRTDRVIVAKPIYLVGNVGLQFCQPVRFRLAK